MSNSDSPETLLRLKNSPIALEDCGLTATALLLGDRWTLLLLRSLFYGVRRFADIKADIAIPSSTLSDRLKRLIDNDLLEEHPYRDGSSRTRHEYVLTPEGESLQIVLMTLMSWGDQHLRQQSSKLTMVSKNTGTRVNVAFVDEAGTVLEPDDIEFRISQ